MSHFHLPHIQRHFLSPLRSTHIDNAFTEQSLHQHFPFSIHISSCSCPLPLFISLPLSFSFHLSHFIPVITNIQSSAGLRASTSTSINGLRLPTTLSLFLSSSRCYCTRVLTRGEESSHSCKHSTSLVHHPSLISPQTHPPHKLCQHLNYQTLPLYSTHNFHNHFLFHSHICLQLLLGACYIPFTSWLDGDLRLFINSSLACLSLLTIQHLTPHTLHLPPPTLHLILSLYTLHLFLQFSSAFLHTTPTALPCERVHLASTRFSHPSSHIASSSYFRSEPYLLQIIPTQLQPTSPPT